MKLSIEKVYSLAAKHPEINVLLQKVGESEEKVLKLRGHVAAWRIAAIGLGLLMLGLVVNSELALDKAQGEIRFAEQARKFYLDKWITAEDKASRWETQAKAARRDEKAVAKLAEECARENPKWGINRP